MEEDRDFKVLSIAESAGHFLDRLNRRVQTLADGVADAAL
jgi:hypothetical protein